MIVVGLAVACVAGWLAAPFVAMRRRGTLDEQRRAAIRAEARHVTAARREARGAASDTAAGTGPVAVPTPAPLPADVTPLPQPRSALDETWAPDETSPSPVPRATPA